MIAAVSEDAYPRTGCPQVTALGEIKTTKIGSRLDKALLFVTHMQQAHPRVSTPHRQQEQNVVRAL